MFGSKELVTINSIIAVLGILVTRIGVGAVFSAPRPHMTPADYSQWAHFKFLNAIPNIFIATFVVFLFNLICWKTKSGEVETMRAWEWALLPALGWSLIHFCLWCASAAMGAQSLARAMPPYQDLFPQLYGNSIRNIS